MLQRQYYKDKMKNDPRTPHLMETSPDSTDIWVCQDIFPVGSYSKNYAGFPMNRLLKMQLDYLLKNVVDDWDFTLLICGEGEVRIGKSTLAQQIATYWIWSMKHLYGIDVPHSVHNNMVFNGGELIAKGNKLGTQYPYSVIIFDEAGADLEGTKTMKQTTQDVKDYLRECGQYNMLNILVLPEYFDLPKGVAISRSIAMINVYWLPDEDGSFERGYFKFYNKPAKKQLYLKGKRDLDYNVTTETFYGRFPRFYTFDEKEYKEAKKEALKNREQSNTKERRFNEVAYALLKIIKEKLGWGVIELTRNVNRFTWDIKVSDMYIPRFITKMKKFLKDDFDWEGDAQVEDDGKDD